MKKGLLVIVCCFALLFGGCARQTGGTEEAPNRFCIDLRSERELEELREMAVCADEDVLQVYLQRKGAQSREDLTGFLELLDPLPYLPLLDGRIIWIGYYSGLDFYSRKPYTPNANLFITTQAQNGDWVRLQYTFPVEEAPTVTGNDGRMTLRSEKREKHPAAPGTLITWDMEVGGLTVRAVYYTQDPGRIVTEEVFDELTVRRFGDLPAGV